MQMPVFPAQRHSEDMMQFGQRGVAPHQQAPADLGPDADQVNLELIASGQAVIVECRRRHNGWGHGDHRRRWAPKLSPELIDIHCPTLFDAPGLM